MENAIDNASILSPKGTFPATVAKIIDNYKLVINRGSEHGIQEGQRMLVYNIDEEDIKDPITGESLGYLEIVRGTGKVIYLQEKISILDSDTILPILEHYHKKLSDLNKKYEELSKSLSTKPIVLDPLKPIRDEKELISKDFESELINKKLRLPFDNPQVGDQVKPI